MRGGVPTPAEAQASGSSAPGVPAWKGPGKGRHFHPDLRTEVGLEGAREEAGRRGRGGGEGLVEAGEDILTVPPGKPTSQSSLGRADAGRARGASLCHLWSRAWFP